MSDLTRSPTRSARRARTAALGSGVEHLVFRITGEAYALTLAVVREILVVPTITLVPRAPAHVLGLISVRGHLVTVLDLGVSLGSRAPHAERLHDLRARVLLVRGPDDETLGLLVDEVQSVVRLADTDIESPEALGGAVGEHVLGIARRDGETLVVLSLTGALGARP